ncbi:MAG: hypothetical protein ACHP7J_06875 [Terriglobales bacterium]
MLADRRSCFLLSFGLAFSIAAWLPVQAQINGVPASVTSLGFGGSNNPTPGVRASVTSLGPNGFGNSRPVFGSCCANFFMPANPNPPLFFDHQLFDRQSSDRQVPGRRHRHGEHAFFPVGASTPAYVPYAVSYPVPYAEDAGDDSLDVDATYARGPQNNPQNPGFATASAGNRDSAPRADASAKPAPGESQDPVVAQPSTVLVFKDGHQSDVLNYAIVGDTLFEFGAGRTRKIRLADLDLPATHKANDERGVDFQIPASAARP